MKKYDLNLKQLRTDKKIKQSDLAKAIDTSQQVISQYENGQLTPSLDRLVEIAQILDVTLDELVEFKKIQHNLSKELIK